VTAGVRALVKTCSERAIPSRVWLILTSHPEWVSWAGLAIALSCILRSLGLADANSLGVWINSDTLWLVNVFTDLFHDGYSLRGWHFSIAPCWFPDVTAVGIFWAITHNVIAATLLAGLVQVVFIVGALHVIGRTLRSRFVAGQDSMLILVAVFCALYVAREPGTIYPSFYKLFVTQTHVGSMLAVLWGWAIALWIIDRTREGATIPRSLTFVYAVLCLLAGMSNLLFFPQMLAPLTLVLVAGVYFGVVTIRECWLPIGAGWPAAALGAVLNHALFKTAGVGAESGVSYNRSLTALDTFMRGFVGKVLAYDGLHLIAMVWMGVRVAYIAMTPRALIIRGLREVSFMQIMRAVFFATCLSSAVLSAASIIVGGSNGLVELKDYVWSMHYLHQIFLLPIFTLPMVFWWLMETAIPAGMLRAATWAVVPVTLLLPSVQFARMSVPVKPIYDYRPPLAQFLDETAATTPLHYGLAGYWQARLITLLSTSGLRVYAVDGGLKPFLWVNNEEWYRQSLKDRKVPPHYDFVVLDDPLWKISRETVVGVFGEPVRELRRDGTRVLIYAGSR